MSPKTEARECDDITPNRLIIVDSSQLLRSACRRYFERYIPDTIECDSLRGVDQALNAGTSTAVICGVFEALEPSSLRIRRWRALKPGLHSLVLMAGTLDLPRRCGADLVVAKPFDPRAVLELFFPTRSLTCKIRASRTLDGAI
jgi:hypothetical protein